MNGNGRAAQTKGITVHERGSTWHYRLELEPHPLTGKRQRENRGGFVTEDDAWSAAMASKQRHGTGRQVRASRRMVRAFLAEWLDAVSDSIKPSTRQNYEDYVRAYVNPLIGDRRMQDITVPVLNLLYRHLLHADTVTRRFNRLVDLAGVRRTRLHDVRHTYATLALDSGVHAKVVSDRIGHAHEGITVQIYGHRSTGHDREAAELVAGLIRTRIDVLDSDAW